MINQPIIFVPGLIISETDFYQKYSGLPDFAEKYAKTFAIQKFDVGTNLSSRGSALSATLNQFDKFHIISHSRGGIDARYALFRTPQFQKKCLSITTISTPHQGSLLADYFFAKPDKLNQYLLQNILGLDPSLKDQIHELTFEAMTELNKQIGFPDCSKFCIPFIIDKAYKAGALDKLSFAYLQKHGEVYSDGVVALASQLFGTPLGTHPLGNVMVNFGSHIAETAPLSYGLFPWSMIWKDTFIMAFNNILKIEQALN